MTPGTRRQRQGYRNEAEFLSVTNGNMPTPKSLSEWAWLQNRKPPAGSDRQDRYSQRVLASKPSTSTHLFKEREKVV